MRGAGDITITSQMGSGIILLHHSKLGQPAPRRSRLLGEASATANRRPTMQVIAQLAKLLRTQPEVQPICLLECLVATERGSSGCNARGALHCPLLPSMLACRSWTYHANCKAAFAGCRFSACKQLEDARTSDEPGSHKCKLEGCIQGVRACMASRQARRPREACCGSKVQGGSNCIHAAEEPFCWMMRAQELLLANAQ